MGQEWCGKCASPGISGLLSLMERHLCHSRRGLRESIPQSRCPGLVAPLVLRRVREGHHHTQVSWLCLSRRPVGWVWRQAQLAEVGSVQHLSLVTDSQG